MSTVSGEDNLSSCSGSVDSDPTAGWIMDGGFILIVASIIAMFWGLSFICEEYSVPAITVFCKRNQISDDIAGAIFIGTGLSLPVLFASFVGLFVANTAIGVGTVVGGNIFNQLLNIALSIQVAPRKTLKLDPIVLTREVFFYLVSCVLVIWAAKGDLHQAFLHAFEREQWLSCLSVPWLAAFVLVFSYILYCLVDGYFTEISTMTVKVFNKYRKGLESWMVLLISPFTSSSRMSSRNLMGELPSSSHRSIDSDEERSHVSHTSTTQIIVGGIGNSSGNINTSTNSGVGGLLQRRHHSYSLGSTDDVDASMYDHYMIDDAPTPSPVPTNTKVKSKSSPAPSNKESILYAPSSSGATCAQLSSPLSAHYLHSRIEEVTSLPIEFEMISSSNVGPHFADQGPSLVLANHSPLEDFSMFIKSVFYSSNDFGCFPSSRKWKLRYFTFNNNGLFYKLDYYLPMRGQHVRFIDVFDLEEVTITDRETFEFNIKLRLKRKSYSFRAPSAEIFHAVLSKMYEFLDDIKKRSESELRALALKSMNEIIQGVDDLADPDNESVGETAFAVPAIMWQKVWYYFTFPLKYLIYVSTPDVRRGGSEHKAILSITISFLWVAVMTYILIDGLSRLANMMNISGAVMGLTIGAWAASYPAAWSSIVVARNGYGDIAVCNAIGSNVFSNYIGLGLPWLTYIVVHGGHPYSALRDDGVVLSILLLAVIMVTTYLMIAWAGFTLKHWMVFVMSVKYLAFILFFLYFTISLES